MILLLAFLLGLCLGALVVAVLPSKYSYPIFRLADRIRAWLGYQNWPK